MNLKLLKSRLANDRVYYSGVIISGLLSVFLVFFCIHKIGLDSYGVVAFLQVIAFVFGKLVGFDTWSLALRVLPIANISPDRNQKLFAIKYLFGLDLLSSILTIFLSIVAARYALSFFDTATEIDIRYAYFFLVVSGLTQQGAIVAIHRMNLNFSVLGIYLLIPPLLKVLIISASQTINLNGILIAFPLVDFASNSILILLSIPMIKQNINNGINKLENINDSVDIRSGLIKYTATIYVQSTMKSIAKEVDVLFVGMFLGAIPLAVYKAAKQIGSFVQKVGEPVINTVVPRFVIDISAGNYNKIIVYMRYMFLILPAIYVILFVIYLIGLKYIIALIWPEPSTQEVFGVSMTLVMMASATSLLGLILSSYHLAIGKPMRTLIAIVSMICVQFICIALFAKPFGVIGAALSYFLAYLVWFVLLALFFIFDSRRK